MHYAELRTYIAAIERDTRCDVTEVRLGDWLWQLVCGELLGRLPVAPAETITLAGVTWCHDASLPRHGVMIR